MSLPTSKVDNGKEEKKNMDSVQFIPFIYYAAYPGQDHNGSGVRFCKHRAGDALDGMPAHRRICAPNQVQLLGCWQQILQGEACSPAIPTEAPHQHRSQTFCNVNMNLDSGEMCEMIVKEERIGQPVEKSRHIINHAARKSFKDATIVNGYG